MLIHPPPLADLPALRALERAAGEPFRALGMAAVADDEPPPLTVLTEFHRAGRVLAAYAEGRPIGYLLWAPVDGRTHVEQVSVHPDHARRGIGRALIDRAEADGGPVAVTLTTFTEVPWNAPYYARIGFRVLDGNELTPGLRAVRAQEAALGLDRWPRVAMRREPRMRPESNGKPT
ncbi:GNAT family N-acetyltransferase [Streptomyces sp. NPDC056411]|uniref:GNAT family N-acetyltransferase n=1 Tax=Streptomyces sp. NPDC056411 TaxID=3345813 RepID=UPI0035D7DAE3